ENLTRRGLGWLLLRVSRVTNKHEEHEKQVVLLCELHASKVKAIDILFVKDEWCTKAHLVVYDFDVAETSGSHDFIAALQSIVAQRIRRIDRQKTKVERIPKHDALPPAGMNVAFFQVRQRQADNRYIFPARLLDRFSGSRDGGSGNRHDQFHVG